MELNQIGFLVNEGLYYPAILNGVGKSSNLLQPLFEGFTNALEAVSQLDDDPRKEAIKVKVYYDADLFDDRIMSKLMIEDTGIGFNDFPLVCVLTEQPLTEPLNPLSIIR